MAETGREVVHKRTATASLLTDTPEQPDHVDSVIFDLPNEIFDRIFYILSEDRRDIGACRLVSRFFWQLSSPYLITQVVFARRFKTLAHLRQVVEHEYFHKYVTELLVDASNYEERIADNWYEYLEECMRAPQDFSDPEYARRILEEEEGWHEVVQLTQSQRFRGQAAAASNHENSQVNVVGDGVEEDDDDDDDDGYDDDDDDDDDDMFVTDEDPLIDHHRSYPDYVRRYLAQGKIDRRDATLDIFCQLIRNLPRLKSVVLTDWRTLARWNESYADCARRLFGTTLAPAILAPAILAPSDQSMGVMGEIFSAISILNDCAIEQFSIGSHTLDDEFDFESGTDRLSALHIPCGWFEPIYCVATNLRRLYLDLSIHWEDFPAIYMPPEDENVGREIGIHRFLAAATSLEHLTLNVLLTPETVRAKKGDDAVPNKVFQACLIDQHYPRLRFLQFQQWNLPQLELQTLLLRNSSSLRFVKFIDCTLLGNPTSLAKWAGSNLSLERIEIIHSLEFGLVYPPSSVEFELEAHHEQFWISGG